MDNASSIIGRVMVYEEVHGSGSMRVLHEDQNGNLYVMWYGEVRNVERVRLLNWPKNGVTSDRYVIV